MRVAVTMLLLSMLLGCGSQTRELTVFAASSLTAALQEIGNAFGRSNSDATVLFNFGSSSMLRMQLDLGAQSDVFVSADQIQMVLAEEAGLIKGIPETFATNKLVVITPLDGTNVETLQDLAKPGLQLVLALPQVPVGAYARQSLEKMNDFPEFGRDFSERVLHNLVSQEINVLQVIAKVSMQEADVAIVYNPSEIHAAANSLAVLSIPDELNIVAEYQAAGIHDSREPILTQAFLEFLHSPLAQVILKKHGFTIPSS